MTAGSRMGATRRALLVGALALLAGAQPATAQEPARPTAGPALDLQPGQRGAAFLESQLSFPRVSFARAAKRPSLEQRFAALGLPFPPAGLYLRVFKVERIVEVWVLPRGGERYAHLVTYPMCAVSGWLGPKRGQGDLQIPEGYYEVESFNPLSEYHLSLRLNYPNEADRRAQPSAAALGGDIYVHGGCQTIGCVPITDEHIRELYWLAVEARAAGARRIPVHVFPTRLDDPGLEWLASFFGADAELMAFWERMQEGYAFFEQERRVPGVAVDGRGRYVVGEPGEVSGLALLGEPAGAPAAEQPAGPVEAPAGARLLGEPLEAPRAPTARGLTAGADADAGDPAQASDTAAATVLADATAAPDPTRAAADSALARDDAARGADGPPGLLGEPLAATALPADSLEPAQPTVAAQATDTAVGPTLAGASTADANTASAAADSASAAASVASAADSASAAPAAPPAAEDPVPGLLGTPLAAPPSAAETNGSEPAAGGARAVTEAGGLRVLGEPVRTEAGGAREESGEASRRRLLGTPSLLGTATEQGPSLHASFLIPRQHRGETEGTHGIPWRIHVRRPGW